MFEHTKDTKGRHSVDSLQLQNPGTYLTSVQVLIVLQRQINKDKMVTLLLLNESESISLKSLGRPQFNLMFQACLVYSDVSRSNLEVK